MTYATGGTIPAPPAATADRVTAFITHGPPDMDPGPTDVPHKGTHLGWHASEAEALAKLADLTRTRTPWAAAHDMTWRT